MEQNVIQSDSIYNEARSIVISSTGLIISLGFLVIPILYLVPLFLVLEYFGRDTAMVRMTTKLFSNDWTLKQVKRNMYAMKRKYVARTTKQKDDFRDLGKLVKSAHLCCNFLIFFRHHFANQHKMWILVAIYTVVAITNAEALDIVEEFKEYNFDGEGRYSFAQ